MRCNKTKDSHLAEYLLRKYKKNCGVYDWLSVMKKRSKGYSTLNTLLKNDRACYLDVCKVTTLIEFKDAPKGYIISDSTKYFCCGT